MTERGAGHGTRASRPLVAVLLLAAPLAACTPLDDGMVWIFGRSMRDQPSLDPYEHPLPSPESSVPFASGNYPAQLEDVGLGQAEGLPESERPPPFTQLMVAQQDPVVTGISNPVEATQESIERGAELFNRYCMPCHGPDGAGGTAPLADNGMPPMPLIAPNVEGYSDGLIYGILTRGRGVMPPYGHRISYFDRWHVVNYVRELQAGGGGGAAAGSGGGGG